MKVVLTAAEKGMNGAVAKAVSIASNMEGGNAYILGQFDNPTNPKAHRYTPKLALCVESSCLYSLSFMKHFSISCFRETTGPEIWYQTDGKIDYLVGGVGTGGTLTGSGQVCLHIQCF